MAGGPPFRRTLDRPKTRTVFHPLEDIFIQVAEAASHQASGLAQTFVLRLLPNDIPQSERASKTRPDGCVVFKEAEDLAQEADNIVYRWYDFALTCEFKLRDTDEKRDDNVTKIVYSMQHTMTLDPCKRFTFGITIENTNMRLWFCSRAIMVVSEAFNFITQPEILVHVFLSLAFASKPELGWDPTIRVVDPDAQKRVYLIEVHGQWYEVLEVLSDFGADAIIGRATRVFRVKLLDTDQIFVLKDVWVEEDRALEHEIYAFILDDVERTFGKDSRRLVASHMLTPADNWLIKTIDGQDDHTKAIMMRGYEPTFEQTFKLVASVPDDKDGSKSVAPMRSTDRELHDELNMHLGSRIASERHQAVLRHRKHYRILFVELALPIWAVTNLHDSFLVLRDCAIALKFIHGSGWIHRDISAGNVYYFDGRGLIGDLEYAKKITIDGTHQMRTGTPDFMAIEAMSNCYLFLPSRYSVKAHRSRLEAKKSNKDPSSVLPQRSGRPDFVQNEAHDIESLWWISIYILFFNGDVAHEETGQQRHARKVWIQRIFPSGFSTTRQHFLIDEKEFHEGVSWLPATFREPADELDSLRDCLVGCYHEFEAAFPRIYKEVFSDLNDQAIDIFELCMGSATDPKISSYKLLGKQRQEALSRPVPPPIPVAPFELGKASGSAPRRRALKDAPALPVKALKMQRVPRPRRP
ncbi:hypothetical protein ACEPAF_5602 [Sanghuangporus sanghuang]